MKGLDEYTDAIEAYEKAIGTLPTENLSKADMSIKTQCEEDIRVVKAKKAKGPPGVVMSYADERLPWVVVREMRDQGSLPHFVGTTMPSSVGVQLFVSLRS